MRRWTGLGLLALMSLVGCTGPQIRTQSDDDPERIKYDVRTIGDVTEVGNVDPMMVCGVGLVVGLNGSGGSAPPGSERTTLEDSLRKNQKLLEPLLQRTGTNDVKQLLNSPDTALVCVSAMIPPGARKGDPLDIEVGVPPQSKVTSLHGGYLVDTVLFNYEMARNLSAAHANSNRALQGHPVARAEGPVVVGEGVGDETAKLKSGKVWNGGRSAIDRPFCLMMKGDQQLARVADAVAQKINQTFHGSSRAAGPEAIATAKSPQVVVINVPAQYRLNLPRFLRVVRLMPLSETTAKPGDTTVKVPYRKRLGQDLFDPTRTVTAALRLEALGNPSVAALKTALNNEHPLVRFCAAESLAYLGEPAAGEVLAQMVEHHAVLRAFSLTAMASLDENVCRVKLRELLRARNPETRYGAFRALRALDEDDECLNGERLNNSFWFHKVAPLSTSLVHISNGKRAEVVLFGDDGFLLPPFSFRAGHYTFVAGDGDTRCTVSHFDPSAGRRDYRQCSLRIEDVIRTLAALGGTYPEVTDLLKQAHNCQCVSCRVEVDRLPQAVSVYELAHARELDPDLLTHDAEILDFKPDLGSTPTLYEKSAPLAGHH
jgi:flagellar basal body P-ring protein FlgI